MHTICQRVLIAADLGVHCDTSSPLPCSIVKSCHTTYPDSQGQRSSLPNGRSVKRYVAIFNLSVCPHYLPICIPAIRILVTLNSGMIYIVNHHIHSQPSEKEVSFYIEKTNHHPWPFKSFRIIALTSHCLKNILFAGF